MEGESGGRGKVGKKRGGRGREGVGGGGRERTEGARLPPSSLIPILITKYQ